MRNGFSHKNVLLPLLFLLVHSQTDLVITLGSPFVQDVTNYTIAMSAVGVPSIPQGSILQLTFPVEYTSEANTSKTCVIVSWPIPTSNVSCFLSYNVLTVQNGFPIAITDFSNTVSFVWLIEGIRNTDYAQTTSIFSGNVIWGGSVVFPFSPNNGVGVSILPGNLDVSLTVAPQTVDASSTLTFAVTPSHSIPSTGYLLITMDNYWAQSVFQINTIIGSNTVCLPAQNTQSNIYCTISTTSTKTLVYVRNAFSRATTSKFAFTLSPFINPPSTQPQGNFTVASMVGLLSLDYSTSNKIYNISPAAITNTVGVLADSSLSAVTPLRVALRVPNIIQSSDTIYVEMPLTVDLSQVSLIEMLGITASSLNTAKAASLQVVSFNGITVNNNNVLSLVIFNLTLPNYATQLSPFNIYIVRSQFQICRADHAFTLATSSGSMSATLQISSSVASTLSSYIFVVNALLDPSCVLVFSFPSVFAQLSSAVCSNCVIDAANNTISVFVKSVSSSFSSTVSNIVNPPQTGYFPSITVQANRQVGSSVYLLYTCPSLLSFYVSPRALTVANVSVWSSSNVTGATANLTFQIRNNLYIADHSYIRIQIPPTITLPAAAICSQQCSLQPNNTILFQQISSSSPLQISVYFIVNPASTRPTASFSVEILTPSMNISEYLYVGLSIWMTTPSAFQFSFSRGSTMNSAVTDYSFFLGANPSITAGRFQVLLPSELTCAACLFLNSSVNSVMISSVNLTLAANLTIQSVLNFYSTEPVTLELTLLDGIFVFAALSYTLQNTIPSASQLAFIFSLGVLAAPTNLVVSNISSTIQQLVLTFGADFNANGVVCTATPYTCTVINNAVTLSLIGTQSSVTFGPIITPSSSPSTLVTVSSYRSSGALISLGTAQWSRTCASSCLTCSALNTSACLSCYKDESLVASQVLFFNMSCKSVCDPHYYNNSFACVLCSPTCLNCLSYSVCTSCTASLYFYNNTCLNPCPTGTYIFSQTCLPCTPSLNCYTCTNELTCSTCTGSYYLSNSVCLAQCPPFTTYPVNNVCQPCPTNCMRCTGTTCISCNGGYLLDSGACVVSCTTPFYLAFNGICAPCQSSCLSCSGTVSNCLSCNSTSVFRYFYSNQCLNECPNGFYADGSFLSCLPCTKPCQFCSTSSVHSCISCISGYTLDGTTCLGTCPSGFYANATNCLPCVNSCLTCSAANLCLSCVSQMSLYASTCVTSCLAGYVQVSAVCLQCSSNCLTCSAITFCLTCQVHNYILNGTCYSNCPSSYFANTLQNVCLPCLFSCKQCANSSFCFQCLISYVLFNGGCVSGCPSGYISQSGSCLKCDASCLQCQQSITNCSACHSLEYFYNNACSVECAAPLVHFQTNLTCLQFCPTNYYLSGAQGLVGGKCQVCPSTCTLCSSSTSCSACTSIAILYNSMCYLVCPLIAPYLRESSCQTCNITDCLTCNGTYCVACTAGLLLISNNSCIATCGNKVYRNYSCVSESLTVNNQISFIPMPFLIIWLLIVVFIFVWFADTWAQMLLTFGGLLFSLCCLATIITFLVSNLSLNPAVYVLMAGYCLLLLLNLGVTIYYLCADSSDHQSSFGLIIMVSVLVHYELLYLKASEEMKSKLGRVISVPVSMLIFSGSLGIYFSVTPSRLLYVYYSLIELCAFAAINSLLYIFWYRWTILHNDEQASLADTTIQAEIRQSQEHICEGHFQSQMYSHSHITPSLSPDYKTAYDSPQIKEPVHLPKDMIHDGIQKGVFRVEEEPSIAYDSELESAAKLNQLRKLREERKEENIFEPPKDQDPARGLYEQAISIEEHDFKQNIIFEEGSENAEQLTNLDSNQDYLEAHIEQPEEVKVRPRIAQESQGLFIEDIEDKDLSEPNRNIFDGYGYRNGFEPHVINAESEDIISEAEERQIQEPKKGPVCDFLIDLSEEVEKPSKMLRKTAGHFHTLRQDKS